jgi:hypothetical protein
VSALALPLAKPKPLNHTGKINPTSKNAIPKNNCYLFGQLLS